MFKRRRGTADVGYDPLKDTAREIGGWCQGEGLCSCQLQAFRTSASTPEKKRMGLFFWERILLNALMVGIVFICSWAISLQSYFPAHVSQLSRGQTQSDGVQ